MNNNKNVTVAAVTLRLFLGWFMFFDGLGLLLTPGWSASGFLLSAKTFPAFYAWFAQPGIVGWLSVLNIWAIILVGVALFFGVGIRVASWVGILLMIIYYFPHYAFPVVTYGYVIDEHLIYAAAFALVAVLPAAQVCSVGRYLRRTFVGQIPFIRSLI